MPSLISTQIRGPTRLEVLLEFLVGMSSGLKDISNKFKVVVNEFGVWNVER